MYILIYIKNLVYYLIQFIYLNVYYNNGDVVVPYSKKIFQDILSRNIFEYKLVPIFDVKFYFQIKMCQIYNINLNLID